MKHLGVNMGTVKNANRSAILKFISDKGPVSRKDVAQATGLTPAAVTQITTKLLDQGILVELGASEEKAGAGRKKILIDIDYNYGYVFSVNIENEETCIALTNLCGNLLEKRTIETQKDIEPEVFLEEIANVCKSILELQKKSVQKKVRAIAVGIPGIVNKEDGLSVHAYGIWEKEVPVCDILERLLGLDAYIENNVNAFARATLLFGEGKEYENLHVIKWGPGVGSTLIIDNTIYEGRHGKAAELGHFIVEKDGLKCSCGRRGCLETKVSYAALNKIVAFGKYDFAEAYSKADSIIKSKIDETIDLFARSLVNSMTILAPNRVVLCGFLFKDALIREEFIKACKYYDERLFEGQIIYTSLATSESYIGPVAVYISNLL